MGNADDYLVIDLEATCDDGGRMPKTEMEIIEIGAVLVDRSTLVVRGEWQSFVRPRRHPRLTAFCTALTTITQAHVDGAPSFPAAIAALAAFIGGRGVLFASWGDYDKHQLAQDAAAHGIALPLGADHLNVKRAFSAKIGSKRRFGMSEALAHVGLPLVGTHHRGIDDARNIARLLRWILESDPTH